MYSEGSVTTATARAYIQSEQLPSHPGPQWTRFVCISDNHSQTFYDLPPGDVLLHAGDLSSWGYPEQVMKTLDWIAKLDYPVKIIIGGNHDLCLDKALNSRLFYGLQDVQELLAIREYVKGEAMKKTSVHYLEYESIEFTTAAGRAWKVYGSPAAPMYASGAFQYVERGEAEAIYAKIPSDTDIVMTHTPAKYCLDVTRRGKNAGCGVLRERLDELQNCRLHVFGHIHEAAGATVEEGGRVGVNAAIARTRAGIVVDLLN